MDQVYFYLIIVGVIVWFLIHFIWTFRFSRWLFAWKYDSPFAVFVSRTMWGAGWVVVPIWLLANIGGA